VRRTLARVRASFRWQGAAVLVVAVMAVGAVGLLAASGIVLAGVHLPTWTALAGTPYGRWLSAKVAVFLAMLGLGGYHHLVIEPRILTAVVDGAEDAGTVRRFRRSVRLEAALGMVALLLAAILGATPPSRAETIGPSPAFRHERTVEGVRVRLEIHPLRPGPNAIRLTVTDADWRPLDDAPGKYDAVFYPTVATTYTYRVFGTINGAPFDVSFACNPGGHVSEEDRSVVKVSGDVTRKGLTGSFGCPRARSEAEFPPR
jgi:uncharacterized membrane protein